MQQPTGGTRRRLKMAASLKHYSAYNKEYARFHWHANVSAFDWWDSYLPQFEAGFVRGNASGAMCSYFQGTQPGSGGVPVPSCASSWLMTDIVRNAWMRPDAT